MTSFVPAFQSCLTEGLNLPVAKHSCMAQCGPPERALLEPPLPTPNTPLSQVGRGSRLWLNSFPFSLYCMGIPEVGQRLQQPGPGLEPRGCRASGGCSSVLEFQAHPDAAAEAAGLKPGPWLHGQLIEAREELPLPHSTYGNTVSGVGAVGS